MTPSEITYMAEVFKAGFTGGLTLALFGILIYEICSALMEKVRSRRPNKK